MTTIIANENQYNTTIECPAAPTETPTAGAATSQKKPTFSLETKTTEILSRNLKLYRLHYHLSQKALAQRAGMSQRGYGKIERCEVAASLDTLDKLAHATGLSITVLLDSDLFRYLRMQKIDFRSYKQQNG